jgi:hypothetical protein
MAQLSSVASAAGAGGELGPRAAQAACSHIASVSSVEHPDKPRVGPVGVRAAVTLLAPVDVPHQRVALRAEQAAHGEEAVLARVVDEQLPVRGVGGRDAADLAAALGVLPQVVVVLAGEPVPPVLAGRMVAH